MKIIVFVILLMGASIGCATLSSEKGIRKTSHGLVDLYSGIELTLLPAGSFAMGSPPDEADRDRSEGPVHTVVIDSFYLGMYEVTQQQWEKVMGGNPASFKSGDEYPVENVSWFDAQKFVHRLSKKTGLSFRLPTEAEWEYACRAGTQTPFYFGSDNETLSEYGWFDANSGGESHPIGLMLPNRWGLFDMHGNVSEWVADGRRGYLSREEHNPQGPQTSNKATHRGGAWLYPAYMCRSAKRITASKDFRTHIIGLRVAMTANEVISP